MTDSGSTLLTGSVTDDSEGVKEKENETNYRDAERPSFPEPGKGRECKNSEVDTEIGELTTYELSLWKWIPNSSTREQRKWSIIRKFLDFQAHP